MSPLPGLRAQTQSPWGQRVMEGVSRFITVRLKLKVNSQKSARWPGPGKRKFLGFSFTGGSSARRRVSPRSLKRMKQRVRELTQRTKGRSLRQIVGPLGRYLRGWRGYYGFAQTRSVLEGLDEWIRRRLRAIVWKHWKRGRRRFKELVQRGVDKDLADKAPGVAKARGASARVRRCIPRCPTPCGIGWECREYRK